MNGRFPGRRLVLPGSHNRDKDWDAEEVSAATTQPWIADGTVVRLGGSAASFTVTEELPPRWGVLRFSAREEGPAGPPQRTVELWCTTAGDRLTAPLRRLAGVRHRHLQPILGTCMVGGREVLVVEALECATLAAERPPLAPTRALWVLDRVARALDALHSAGLCHLAVRPEHVYLPTDEREVVLGGLFQVRLEALTAGGSGTTWPGLDETAVPGQDTLLSVCAYLAPEQILAEKAESVHRRTDVYGLAAVAFHLMTGSAPFGPDGEMATLGAHLGAWRPSASARRPDLGEAVDAVLNRGLQADPPARPPSCGEFLDDLRAALAAMPAPADLNPKPAYPCVLVVAGSAAARRELQGLVSAISPRHPVLADAGNHARTLALRYRPAVVLLHQPSLSGDQAVQLCRDLCQTPELMQTQVVAVLTTIGGPEAQALSRLGAIVTPTPATSSTSGQHQAFAPAGRTPDTRPLVQHLRRLLSPPSRGTRRS